MTVLPKQNIFLGNGSDEIIGLLIQTFCQPKNDNVIILPPTFGVYEVAATIGDVGIKKINLDQNFQPKVNTILKSADSRKGFLLLN